MSLFNSSLDRITAYTNGELINSTNGLIIVALLLVIYWCLLRKERKNKFPLFCRDCTFLRNRILNRSQFCRKKCTYNPVHRLSAYRSFYKKQSLI